MAHRRVVSGFAMTALLAACGGAPPPPPKATAEPAAEPQAAPAEDKSAEPTAPSEAPAPKDDRPMQPEDWSPSQTDCSALQAQYERLLLQVEMDKIAGKKMTDKLKAAAVKNAHDVAKKGAENWGAACDKIVGSHQQRFRWQCAAKATTLDRFKGCMDGRADAEAR
jgi:hypothetical protein